MSAKLIEISGIDGSGKTTGFKYLCDQLEAKGKKVLRTREVGSELIPACVELRKTVLNGEYTISGAAMELIFSAMRLMNHDYYRNAAKDYDFIVSDRGWMDHLAYSGAQAGMEFTDNLYRGIIKPLCVMPDKIIYFDVEPQLASKRRVVRNETKDAIESKGDSFLEKVSLLFKTFFMKDNTLQRTIIIDANKDLDAVKESLDKVVELLVSR